MATTTRTCTTLLLTLALAGALAATKEIRGLSRPSAAAAPRRAAAARSVDGCREEPAPPPVETLGCR
jgi:hypothetical protein